ncbi:MAG: HU family DNA-binding protein [Succinivibrio sp.]
MNKSELIAKTALIAGVSQAQTKNVVDALLEAVKQSLGAGETIQLVGFGTFKVSERAARKGRNPQTGAEIQIAACKVPAFSAGADLKKAVNK